MRLLKLSIGSYNVLQNLAITFSPSAPNDRRGFEIDFLVGLNGSGKSTILRALAEIFLRLEGSGGTQNTIPFAFSITYQTQLEGQERTVTITNRRTEDARLVQADARTENMALGSEIRVVLDEGEATQAVASYDNRFLPQSIVILTTGREQDWHDVEKLLQQREQEVPLSQALTTPHLVAGEQVGSYSTGRPAAAQAPEAASQRITFVRSSQLPLVMLCGLLAYEIARSGQLRTTEGGFAEVLSRSRIQRLVGFSLRFRVADPFSIDSVVEKLHRECRPSRALRLGKERLLVFDMGQDASQRAREIVEPFYDSLALFLQLAALSRSHNPDENTLQEVDIFLERKHDQAEAADGTSDEASEPVPPLHLFAWMSDGEQSFLSRMALLSLMRARGALIMLDEPEVHFNDYWKRHIVNLVHHTLGQTRSHVLITTHSSITLTDVRREDIVKIVRQGTFTTGGQVDIPIRTLAADPGDIMVHVFDTGYATGEHAVREVLEGVKPGSVLSDQDRDDLRLLLQNVAPGYWSYLIRRAIRNSGPVATG